MLRGHIHQSSIFPAINGEVVPVLGSPSEGFDRYVDAKNATTRYHESRREVLAQTGTKLLHHFKSRRRNASTPAYYD